VSSESKKSKLSSFASTSSFSARKLLVFVAVFAPIAVYVVIRTLAATPNALPGDINGDSSVNTLDLSIVLSNFGKTAAQSSDVNADINTDGAVNISDLSIVLSNYGKTVTSGAPAAPTGVKATAGNGQVTITWNANTEPDLSYYAVRRSTSSTADMTTWTRLASNYTTTTATDTGLTNGTTYYYYVTAVNTAIQTSARSNVVSATPTSGTTTPPPPPPSTGGNPTPTGVRIFDGTRLTSWPGIIRAASDRITEVPDPLGSGKTVLKFTVDDSDACCGSSNPRAQIQTSEFINPGDEIWWGGRILFPTDFPNIRDVSSSSHGWVSTGSVFGPPYAGSSPITLGINKCTCNSEPYWGEDNDGWTSRYWGIPQSTMRGHWMTWLVHEKFASNGWQEVWVDGKQVMPRTNLTLVNSSNDGGANHITQNFYRLHTMWAGKVTMYHADFGVWKVN
jgi:hypothetical protein